jgi:O-antigen/teichoic acid export membrane protein
MVVARPFFTAWAGHEFGENSTGPFYILLLGLIFNFSATVSGAVMVAAQKTKAAAILYWVELIPYLVLAGILTYHWGAMGAAFAWSIRVIAESVALLLLVQKLVGLRFDFKKSRVGSMLVATLFLAGAPLLAVFAPSNYGVIFGVAFLGLVLYSITIWRMAITEDERIFVLNKIQSFAN